MAEKSDIIKMGGEEHKSKLVGISILLLSMLLVGSVAAIIFLAVTSGSTTCAPPEDKSAAVDVQATINLKTSDGEKKERIEYSQGGHISYFYGEDGSFDMTDFRKGISVTKDKDSGICYLIPVGANQTRDKDVKAFLDKWDGQVMEAQNSEVEVEIFDDKLSDTSFLPQKAHDECTDGYKWMSIVRTGEVRDIEKRSVECHYHLYYYWCTNDDGELVVCGLLIRHCIVS